MTSSVNAAQTLLVVLLAIACLAADVSHAHHAPPAQPVAPEFVIDGTDVLLSGPCEPRRVARRVIALLDAFNNGRARAFSRGFAVRAEFHPYNGTALAPPPGRGRWRIERFVGRRHKARDSWTATRLTPPQTSPPAPPANAVYGLSFRVRVGSYDRVRGSKLVIDCRSGNIDRWVGPALTS